MSKSIGKQKLKVYDCAAKRLKRKLVIGFQYRYDGRSAFLRRAVKDGSFGEGKSSMAASRHCVAAEFRTGRFSGARNCRVAVR